MCSSLGYTCLTYYSLFPTVSLCPLRQCYACSKYLDHGRHRRKLHNVYPGTRLVAARTRVVCLLDTLNRYVFPTLENRCHQNLAHCSAAEPAAPQFLFGSSILREYLHERIISSVVYSLRL